MAQFVRAAAAGNWAKALKFHDQFYPLFKDLFIETNPGPVKAALAMMGQIEEEYRLPLVGMDPKNREALNATLVKCGILRP
jgi:4-hydroxy-tetrahydrodipicolinate synthase